MGAVSEDKEVGEGRFKYKVTTHKEVNRVLRPLLAEHGLVDYLCPESMDIVDTGIRYGQAGKERPLLQHRGEYWYVVVNIDNPEEEVRTQVTGWGEDQSDKGPGKASTYAFKAGRTKMFSISSGDDEEGRIDDEKLTVAPDQTISPEQIDEILALADELFGSDADDVIKKMLANVFPNVKGVSGIPAAHINQATRALNNKAKNDKRVAERAETQEKNPENLKTVEVPPKPPKPMPEEEVTEREPGQEG